MDPTFNINSLKRIAVKNQNIIASTEGRLIANNKHPRWDVNLSAIMDILIHNTGRFVEHYASDLLIHTEHVHNYVKNGIRHNTVFFFGLRESGVDHDAYIANHMASSSYPTYRRIYALVTRIDIPGNNITFELKDLTGQIFTHRINDEKSAAPCRFELDYGTKGDKYILDFDFYDEELNLYGIIPLENGDTVKVLLKHDCMTDPVIRSYMIYHKNCQSDRKTSHSTILAEAEEELKNSLEALLNNLRSENVMISKKLLF